MENMKYFKGSALVTLVGLVTAYMYGGLNALVIVSILAILEISLSFDNAVVNAKVLNEMTPKWQHRFLTWGMVIAVFGMRVVFPLVVVAVAASLGPIDALQLALNEPDKYAEHLQDAHVSISAFGGAFLLLVGLTYFLDSDKDIHWVPFIEEPLSALDIKYMEIGITLGLVLLLPLLLNMEGNIGTEFIISGCFGILVFMMVDILGHFLDNPKEAKEMVAKGGLGLFLYLEVLDSSFSFDGVIGAFAISNNLIIIAIGLGIGAMFVRSLTIMLVEKGTLKEYVYLENAAFYAIMALAIIMFLKVVVHVPDLITGLLGAGFIITGFITSIYSKQQEA